MSNDPPPFSLRSSSGSSKNKQNQAQAQPPPPPPQEESSPNLPKSPSFGALPGPMPPPASAGSLRRNNAQHCRSSSQGGQPVPPNDHPVRGVFTVHVCSLIQRILTPNSCLFVHISCCRLTNAVLTRLLLERVQWM